MFFVTDEFSPNIIFIIFQIIFNPIELTKSCNFRAHRLKFTFIAIKTWLDSTHWTKTRRTEFFEVENFRFMYKGKKIPIRYPKNTAALVVPMSTVTVLAFLLFLQDLENARVVDFFEKWVLFPVRSYPIHYMQPFTLMEEKFRADKLPRYKPGWEQQMKVRRANSDELQSIWTNDCKQYGWKGYQTIQDQFAVFESFCDNGFIGFHLVPVAKPRSGAEPKEDDALFENRGGITSYAFDKNNPFRDRGVFVPHQSSNVREHSDKESSSSEEGSSDEEAMSYEEASTSGAQGNS